jgi:hypothetical protein
LTVNPLPSCSLTVPGTLPAGGSTGNSLCVTTDGVSYQWSVSSTDNSWIITGGGAASCVTYTAGTGGSTGTFNVTVTSAEGCTSTCSVSFEAMSGEFCTRTQGYYGGSKGKTCNGWTPVQNIQAALNQGPLVIGFGSNKITFSNTDAVCLNGKLPAGGSPAVLPAGAVTCSGATGSAYLNNGKFKSVIWGQLLALSLNVRLDANLGALQLTAPYMCTLDATSCVNGVAIAGTQQLFYIPIEVLNYLGADKSVNHLIQIANIAIGGTLPTIPGVATPTLSQINAALDALCGFTNSAPMMASAPASGKTKRSEELENGVAAHGIALTSYPNPFSATTTVEFEVTTTTDVTVEVYSVNGARVAVLYNGIAEAGSIYAETFDATNLAPGMYLCRISTADNNATHKLLLVK